MPSDAPTGGESNFYYSTNVGAVHLLCVSSEHPAGPGSAQAAWAAADLAAVDAVATPWVVAVIHRPIYSAALLEWADHSPGGKLSAAWEPLFLGRVDLVLAGHLHGGQVCIPWPSGRIRLSQINHAYTDGIFTRGDATMHVSRGVGTTFVPVRYFARPEITILRLVPAAG